MNCKLQKEFTRTEVKEALKNMTPLKSLGLDKFGACFYQSYQSLVGDEVSNVVLDFLNGGRLDKSLNAIDIVLIPKNKSHEGLESTGLLAYAMFCIKSL